MFPYPNWLQNHHFSGGISALCCSKNDIFRRLSGKWLSWEAQFRITINFPCILDRIFIIPRLILLQFVMAVCRSRTRVQDHEWQENLRTAISAWRDHTKKEIDVSDHVLMTTSNGQGMPTKVYEISYLRLCGYDNIRLVVTSAQDRAGIRLARHCFLSAALTSHTHLRITTRAFYIVHISS